MPLVSDKFGAVTLTFGPDLGAHCRLENMFFRGVPKLVEVS